MMNANPTLLQYALLHWQKIYNVTWTRIYRSFLDLVKTAIKMTQKFNEK